MTLIDGDKLVTAQLYDDEHEEFREEQMSIIDYVNAYTTEGVTTADNVLDKIRAEALSLKINYTDFDSDVYRRGINDVLKIIDRFKVVADIDHTCHTCKHYLPGEYDGSCGSYICKGFSNWKEKE